MGTPILTTGPLKQALVAKLRANNAIKSAAVGGIHEGINTKLKIEYPHVVFNFHPTPLAYEWGSVTILAAFDIVVRGLDPVKVNSLDALITSELNDSTLEVTELPEDVVEDDVRTLSVRREMELGLPPDRNARGEKVYQNGGQFSLIVDQRLRRTP